MPRATNKEKGDKCIECGERKVEKVVGEEGYCKKCYYKCEDIDSFLKNNNIFFMQHASEKNLIIIKNPDEKLVEFCVDFGFETWFDVNTKKYLYIQTNAHIQKED